jgi:WS/DGAT/MGAT family acyltransferase
VRDLLALVSRLHGSLLDRQRPLWEMHLIEGLAGDRFALYSKFHHALLDGVAGMRLLEASLATDADSEVAPAWAPRAGPDVPRSEGGGLDQLLGLPGTAVRAAADLVALAPALAKRAVSLLEGQALVPPRTILNVPITGARRYAAQSWPLEQVRTVAKAAGATINDVVLGMCSSALREYLADLAALPDDPLIAMTPVSLEMRGGGGSEEGGNAVGAILCNLATNRADPAERLTTIHDSMVEGKAAMEGLSAFQATVLSAFQVAPLALSAVRSLVGIVPQPFNLIISNIPGPRETLYLDGARLAGVYPLSVPIDGQALNVTVTSYDGSLEFGLTGDRRALPHLQRLLGHLEHGLADLALAVGV